MGVFIMPKVADTPAKSLAYLRRADERLRLWHNEMAATFSTIEEREKWRQTEFYPRVHAVHVAMNPLRPSKIAAGANINAHNTSAQEDIEKTARRSTDFDSLIVVRDIPHGYEAPGYVDPTEDLATFTETDPNSRITVTSARVTWASLTRNETTRLTKDFTAGHFTASFTHRFNCKITAANQAGCCSWCLSNDLHDFRYWQVNATASLIIYHYNNGTGTDRIYLFEQVGSGALYSDYVAISLNTDYYITMRGVAGSTNYIYADVYTDSSRSTLLKTLSLTRHNSQAFQYLFAQNSYNDGNATLTNSGWAENFDIGEWSVKTILGALKGQRIIGGGLR